VLKLTALGFPQFPGIVKFCQTLAEEGKIVIVAALDGTYQREVCIYYVTLGLLAQSQDCIHTTNQSTPGNLYQFDC